MTINVTKSWRIFLQKWGGNMHRNLLLTRSNIRKAKGQTVAIIVLVLLSSLMMNLWLMLSMDYRKNFERSHDKLNDGHINIATYAVSDDFTSFVSDMLENRSDITEYTVGEAFSAPISFEYNGGNLSQFGVIIEKENALSRKVGKMEITEDSDIKSGIYLPMIYGTGNNYKVGDTFKISIFDEEFEYTVCGFFNSAMIGSHNCSMVALLLTDDKMEELYDKYYPYSSAYISARVKFASECEEISAEIKGIIAEEYPDVMLTSNDYEMITTSRYVSQSICTGILSAMALLVLLICVVVITSNITNFIGENMQNLGALKAVGYTSGKIISSLLTQFVGITVIAAIVGITLSYGFFPPLNEMMIAQTGIPYSVRFQPLPLLLTLIFIAGIVLAAVYFSARKIKKIEPITAMRQGITTHNFKKNKFPFEKTSLSLNAALAMKSTFSNAKQNLTVCVTMLVVSLIAVFSATMFTNVITDVQPMVEMIVGEYSDSGINVELDSENRLISLLESDSRVEKFYLYTTNNMEVHHVGGSTLYVSVVDDCSKLNNQNRIIEGRYPKYDNEIAIAVKYAKDSGIKIGDEISVKADISEANYIVTGFSQETNYLGKDCVLTREGFEKIGTLPNATYYIDLVESVDVDGFNAGISEHIKSGLNTAENIKSLIDSASSVYIMLVKVIVAAIIMVSCIVIVFVMYLLVRTSLNRKKRDYGILKAIGFTTSKLVLQTAISFMPSVIISAAIGTAFSIPLINPLMALVLGGVGIVRGTFDAPVLLCLIAGGVLVIFTFGAVCLMSLRVKKIAPRELLTGE
ncbi:ABC transporter permease [Lachnospiraceae bacterium]|nr:ABC transporter permease [Lachnospiraceae bacterium]